MTPCTLLVVLSSLLPASVPEATAAHAAGAPTLHPIWERPLAAARGAALQYCANVGERVLVVDSAGGITALQPGTGELLWFVQAPGPIDSFLPSDGGAIALASGTDVLAIDGPTGRRLFSVRSASAPAYSPCSDGRLLYVPSLLDDTVVAWNMTSGIREWEFHMPSPFAGPSVICGGEGTRSVLVTTEDGILRAIPAQIGVPERERWTQRVGRLVGMPLVTTDLIFVSSSDRAVMAIDVASGGVRWKHFTGEPPRSTPVVIGDRVAVMTVSRLEGLDRKTGSLLWEQPVAARPIGDVGGELLVRHSGAGCELRELATGRVLVDELPAACIAAGGMMIELRNSSSVVGWKASAH